MDGQEFERVYGSFRAFHAEYAPDFGRKQWRENSEQYLQGLLGQAGGRREAEKKAEAPPISAPAPQRLLPHARWGGEGGVAPPPTRLAPPPEDPPAARA